MADRQLAKLILEDGTEFSGWSFGAGKNISGEVVFNTGMVGYPETLTDPSYLGQILVCTYPLIGNYGVPGNQKENDLLKYFESCKIQIQGLIVSEYSEHYSHWNASLSLSEWMMAENIPGISGIDTRKLTKKLRLQGTMPGKIITDESTLIDFDDPNRRNLASEAGVRSPVRYDKPGKRVVLSTAV